MEVGEGGRLGESKWGGEEERDEERDTEERAAQPCTVAIAHISSGTNKDSANSAPSKHTQDQLSRALIGWTCLGVLSYGWLSCQTKLPCVLYLCLTLCVCVCVSCCRAIMEHKELLRVPWDWQIGEC